MPSSPETLPTISHILHNKSWQNFDIKELAHFLSLCYSTGLSLQSEDFLDDMQNDGKMNSSEHKSSQSLGDEAIDKEQWLNFYEELEELLPFKYTYANASPFESDQHDTEEYDSCSLLTDIIVDLSEGARLYEHNQGEALCHWQMTFEISWGEKSLILLRALHQYIIEEC